jgi:hypothetical protein
VLHPQDDAPKVDIERAVVVVHGDVGGERAGPDAGDVAQHVEAPELRHGPFDHRLDVRLVGDVGMERDHGVAGFGGGVLLGAADVGRQHLRALTGEQHRRRLGHPRSGAGDHGDLAVEQADDARIRSLRAHWTPLLVLCSAGFTRSRQAI